MDPSSLIDAVVDASNRQTEELRRSTIAFIILNRQLAGMPIELAEAAAEDIYRRAIHVAERAGR